ncbi:hypothetical protein VTN77DRAFT_7735 [Rasamsonia byssochlamydoides]|uniref:uncharacterized protein n=1 Tax=Rasamsonia byssochlamydoides TaxID=89139 RepID=UPI003742AECB
MATTKAASRARSNSQIKDQLPKTLMQRPLEAPKQLVKKGTSYADVAALMATRPGGQEWQVVPARQKKAQKSSNTNGPKEPQQPESLVPAKEKNKEARRLLFQRDEGLAAPKAEREEVILAINRALAKKGFPSFI